MIKKDYKYLILIFFICCFFMFPYMSDKLNIEHDTLFHLSRIEGYATAIKNLDFFPKIYYFKNNGFGYASPLFYCDILLLPFSLLYILKVPLAITYKIAVFTFIYLSSLSIFHLVKNVSKSSIISVISLIFSNYFITDVYVRSSLGELMAFVFICMLINSIYLIFYKNYKTNLLFFSFLGLVLTHNLSLILGMILLFIFTCLNFKKLNKNMLFFITKSCTFSIICSLFFIAPIIEMNNSSNLYLKYYLKNNTLFNTSLYLNQFFQNETTFSIADNSLNKVMLINSGYFLMFTSLFGVFSKNNFIKTCTIIAYILMFMTSAYFPFDLISFLSILQFPFRLNLLIVPLLSVLSSYIILEIKSKKSILVIIVVLLIEGFFHLLPVLNRPFYINNNTKYENLLDGSIIDPYYSAFYVRVELAGGEYLPINTPNIKEYGTCIKDDKGNVISCDYKRKYNDFIFNINNNGNVVLPISYYKGYSIYNKNTNKKIKIIPNENMLISFYADESGTYICKYENTFIQNISLLISILFSIALLTNKIIKGLKNTNLSL